MKINFINLLGVFVLTVMILSSCVEKTMESYNLTIVVLDPVAGNKNDNFPDYFNALCYPILTPKEETVNFASEPVKLERLGVKTASMDLKFNLDNKKSNINNPNYRKNWVAKYFDDALVGKDLSEPNSEDFDKEILLKKYLEKKSNESKYGIFYYSNNGEAISNDEQKIFENTDSLRNSIMDFLLVNSQAKIIVVINPPETETVEGTDRVDRPKVITKEPSLVLPPKEPQIPPLDPEIPNKPPSTDENTPKVIPTLKINLQGPSLISWTDMGKDFNYNIRIESFDGEDDKYLFQKANYANYNLPLSDLKIKDSRRYRFSVEAISKSILESKKATKVFNLIDDGTRIDPQCNK